MFLDGTYFQGELSIPNFKFRSRETSGVAAIVQAVGESSLEWFVGKYEEEFLVNILGRGLYEKWIGGLEDEESETYSYWTELRDRIFIRKGNYGYSPVANYVYYWLMRNGNTRTSSVGEVKARIDHADVVDVRHKLVKAWNDMRQMIEGIHRFILKHPERYGMLERECLDWFHPINLFNI